VHPYRAHNRRKQHIAHVIMTTERNALLFVVAPPAEQGTRPLANSSVFHGYSNFYYYGFAPSVEG
jgi:hypothetical protein